VRDSHEKIHQQEEAYSELRKGHVGENEDEKAIEQLDADGSIRAAIAERARNREGAETHQEAKK
jgi:cell division protein FtsB